MPESLWEIGLTLTCYVFTMSVSMNMNSFSSKRYNDTINE